MPEDYAELQSSKWNHYCSWPRKVGSNYSLLALWYDRNIHVCDKKNLIIHYRRHNLKHKCLYRYCADKEFLKDSIVQLSWASKNGDDEMSYNLCAACQLKLQSPSLSNAVLLQLFSQDFYEYHLYIFIWTLKCYCHYLSVLIVSVNSVLTFLNIYRIRFSSSGQRNCVLSGCTEKSLDCIENDSFTYFSYKTLHYLHITVLSRILLFDIIVDMTLNDSSQLLTSAATCDENCLIYLLWIPINIDYISIFSCPALYVCVSLVHSLHRPSRHSHSRLVHWPDVCHRSHHTDPPHCLLY